MTISKQPPISPGGQFPVNLDVAAQLPVNLDVAAQLPVNLDVAAQFPASFALTVQLPTGLAVAAQRIDEALTHNPHRLMSLSDQARTELEVLHAEYLGDLGQEAVRVARRGHLSTVDRTHVIQAADLLRGDPSGVFSNITNSIGGVFAGAGLAGLYSLVFTAGKHSSTEIAVTLVLSVIGFVLLTAGVTAMVIRRRP
jgi:hypothetical protein